MASSQPTEQQPNKQQTTTIKVDFGFLVPNGAIYITQMVFAIVICGCVSHGACIDGKCYGTKYEDVHAGGQQFVLFVVGSCIVVTFVFFVAHFFRLQELQSMQALASGPWKLTKIELTYTGIASMLYFGAFCIEAAYSVTPKNIANAELSAWVAAAVFLSVNTVLYVILAWLCWRASEYCPKRVDNKNIPVNGP